jgi:hypothetical protein
MFERVQRALRRFNLDPLGAWIELGINLLVLTVCVSILIALARVGWRMVQGAFGV